MKTLCNTAPFLLWSIATLILTVVAFMFLPVLLLIEKIKK